MWTTITPRVLVLATLALTWATAAGAETVTYRGTGTYVLTRAGLPLANGGMVMHLAHDTVATIEPSESGFIFGDCAGLGYLTAEGEFSSDIVCTFTERAGDGFDIRARGSKSTGTVEIIGGSGKWTAATGTGTVERRWAEGNQGSYAYEFKITTP